MNRILPIERMIVNPTFGLRIPTIHPHIDHLPSGQAYCLFDKPVVIVRDIIAAKITQELCKRRAGGPVADSLSLLVHPSFVLDTSIPAHEDELVIEAALINFLTSGFIILCDGQPLVDLDEPVELSRTTKLAFVHVPPPAVVAAAYAVLGGVHAAEQRFTAAVAEVGS